jgi:hypothetical protein
VAAGICYTAYSLIFGTFSSRWVEGKRKGGGEMTLTSLVPLVGFRFSRRSGRRRKHKIKQ